MFLLVPILEWKWSNILSVCQLFFYKLNRLWFSLVFCRDNKGETHLLVACTEMSGTQVGQNVSKAGAVKASGSWNSDEERKHGMSCNISSSWLKEKPSLPLPFFFVFGFIFFYKLYLLSIRDNQLYNNINFLKLFRQVIANPTFWIFRHDIFIKNF